LSQRLVPTILGKKLPFLFDVIAAALSDDSVGALVAEKLVRNRSEKTVSITFDGENFEAD
jgi:hypothetical protein